MFVTEQALLFAAALDAALLTALAVFYAVRSAFKRQPPPAAGRQVSPTVRLLGELLNDGNLHDRLAAVAALGRLGATARLARTALAERADDPREHPAVRRLAAELLRKLDRSDKAS